MQHDLTQHSLTAPISRRRFLGTSLAMGAALCLSPSSRAFAQNQERSGDVFALISDTHIPGDRNRSLRDVNPVANLVKIREDILACPKKPQGAIISGDCVFLEGLATDYPTLLEELQPLRDAGMSVHLLPGNHDNRSHLLNALAKHDKISEVPSIPENYCSVLETPKVNWFFLDSLQRTNDTPGLLGQTQLNWLAAELDRRPNKPALLVAHHNLIFELPDPLAWRGHLRDSDAFWDVIASRKQVKGYVYGHSHCWSLNTKDDIHLINVPATAWKFAENEPTAWVLAELKTNGIDLTPRALDPQHPVHDKSFSLQWRS